MSRISARAIALIITFILAHVINAFDEGGLHFGPEVIITPLSVAFTVKDGGANQIPDTNTIAITFNGSTVSPVSITKTGIITTISYSVAEPWPSGSINHAVLTLRDTKGWYYKADAWPITPYFATLSIEDTLPDSSVDKTRKGFKVRVYQTDGGLQEGTIAYNEGLLAGLKGPNVANLNDAGGVDDKGFFTWLGLINFDTTPGGGNGFFDGPDYPDASFPGIPGTVSTGGNIENFAEEILAALEFKISGMYTMAVQTDWTDFANITDGYLVRAGIDPLASSNKVVGYYDAAAPDESSRGAANKPFQFYVRHAGIYPFRLMYYQSSGTANLEWFLVNHDGTRTLVNDPTKIDAIPAYYAWIIPSQAPMLAIAYSTNSVTIKFTGTLEETLDLSGAEWQTVIGSNEVTLSANGPAKFFRTKK